MAVRAAELEEWIDGTEMGARRLNGDPETAEIEDFGAASPRARRRAGSAESARERHKLTPELVTKIKASERRWLQSGSAVRTRLVQRGEN